MLLEPFILLTSVRVKQGSRHRALSSAPYPLIFRARCVRKIKEFSFSEIHVNSHSMALRAHDVKRVLWEIPRSRASHKARCPHLTSYYL